MTEHIFFCDGSGNCLPDWWRGATCTCKTPPPEVPIMTTNQIYNMLRRTPKRRVREQAWKPRIRPGVHVPEHMARHLSGHEILPKEVPWVNE